MSLWTPGGEHPVDRGDSSSTAAEPSVPSSPSAARAGEEPQLTAEQQADAEAMAAEMAQVREQMASMPANVVVANHAMGLYELAAIHLSQQPPNTVEAKVAIDGMQGLIDALKGRLGPDEPVLVNALAQLQLAFVQVSSAAGNPSPPPADEDPGS